MASENAVKDNNRNFGLLVHSSDGTETRQLKLGAGGGLPTENAVLSTVVKNLDVDESEDNVSATAAVLTGYYVSNLASSNRYLKIYNDVAANVVVGTTVPYMTIGLAGNQSANLSGLQLNFPDGFCIAATTGVADNDTGAPAANEVIANIFIKA